MSKSTKTSIIIIIVLVVFLLVVYLLSKKDGVTFQSNKNEAYLVVGQNAMFSYHNKKMYNVPLNSQLRKELDWNEFKVLDNYKVKGNYLMHYDDKWYLFDKDRKSISYESNTLIAYKSNYDIDYIYKEGTDIVDDTYVYNVADELGIIVEHLTVNKELDMDIDNDGNNETFYLFSNALPVISSDTKEYAVVFMVKDNKIYIIYNTLTTKYSNYSCQPNIEGFINLNGDNQYEIIISCSTMSINEQRVNIYELTKENNKLSFELKASNS